MTVVLAAAGYPDAPQTEARIDGIEAAEAEGALVFHAGTALRDGTLVSAGGRVLSLTSVAPSVGAAREQVYRAVDQIEIPGAQYRRDIALGAVHATA